MQWLQGAVTERLTDQRYKSEAQQTKCSGSVLVLSSALGVEFYDAELAKSDTQRRSENLGRRFLHI